MSEEPKPERVADLEFIDQLRAEDVARREKVEGDLRGIQARLYKRIRESVLSVPFRDDDGEFTVDIYIPTIEARERIVGLQSRVKEALKAQDFDELHRLNLESAYILESLCVDPNLDAEYWLRKDAFSYDVPSKLLVAAITGEVEGLTREDAEFFRPESSRDPPR